MRDNMEYNKAIRDKIPEIIQKDGHSCSVKTLSDEEFLEHLEKKLSEEVAEYQNDKNPEELADILEVIYRIAQLKGCLLYTSPSPRDGLLSRMPSSA